MSRDTSRPTPGEIAGDLAGTLRTLRRELRTGGTRRRRGLDRLVRFTSEVTIPATILVLETNIRALQLLQRTLRMARDGERESRSSDVSTLGQSVVDRIDQTLSDAQTAVEDAAAGEEVQELVAEARELNRQLEASLDPAGDTDEGATASVDVESELASLRDEYADDDDRDGDEDGPESS